MNLSELTVLVGLASVVVQVLSPPEYGRRGKVYHGCAAPLLAMAFILMAVVVLGSLLVGGLTS